MNYLAGHSNLSNAEYYRLYGTLSSERIKERYSISIGKEAMMPRSLASFPISYGMRDTENDLLP